MFKIPNAVELQHIAEEALAMSQAHQENPKEAPNWIEMLWLATGTLPPGFSTRLRKCFASMTALGNFCNAGGQIVFVRPPGGEKDERWGLSDRLVFPPPC